MKKKFQKGDENWMAFIDIYQFVQEFWVPEAIPTYWEQMVDGATKLRDKYSENEFVREMILAFMDSRQKEFNKKEHS